MIDMILEPDPTEDRALLAFYDAVADGAAPPDAMARTVAAFPAQARLIGDHALNQMLVASEAVILTEDEVRRAEDHASAVLTRQRAAWQASQATSQSPAFSSIFAAAKARGIARASLAQTLGIGTTILTKLERRLIGVLTIPSRLVELLAQELGHSRESVWAYLAGTPTLAVQANYRAKQTPRTNAAAREDFSQALATAVRLGEVTSDNQVLWQDEIASGRVGQ